MGAIAIAALTLLAAPQSYRDGNITRPPQVTVHNTEGRLWYSVSAQNASATRVLNEIARVANRDITGLAALDGPTLVTIDLVDRPLDQVLEYTLGSLGFGYGLSRTAIEVLPMTPDTSDAHLDLAATCWIRASSRFPDHIDAPRARLAQGEIAEIRGLLPAARSFYLTLTEDYPNSEVVGEAYIRAGRISAQLGQHADAARIYRALANLETSSEYHAAARLELARTMVAQGDPQAALYMLSALETNYPTEDVTERTARQLVKARAYNARGLYMEALNELDHSDPYFDDFGRWEALYIRAVALAGIGMPGDAARAWLLYAENAEGNDRMLAYQEAARLALEADDELAVLFIARQAEAVEAGANIGEYIGEARRRLGFGTNSKEESVLERVTRAEAMIDDGDFESATELLRPLFLGRGSLVNAELDARVCVDWARCIDETIGFVEALDVLSQSRETFTSPELRQMIDIGAARLFEKHERFDDAVDAYQGKYAKP